MAKVDIIIPHIFGREIRCEMYFKRQIFQDFNYFIIEDKDWSGAAETRNKGFQQTASMDNPGKYVFFCDDDVELDFQCLAKMVNVLDREPDVSFVYCDYQKAGKLFGLNKSQEWNPEQLKRQNYISSMSLIRRDDFSGFDPNMKHYDDWDLWLTMAEQGRRGYYIPETLFTAYFSKGDISMGTRKDDLKWIKRVKDKHGIEQYDYSIITVARSRYINNIIDSIMENTYGNYEIVVLKHTVEPGIDEYLKHLDYIRYIDIGEAVFSALVSIGVEESYGDLICFLYDDCLLTPGWNQKLYQGACEKEDAGVIGPMTSYAKSIQQINRMAQSSRLVNKLNILNVLAEFEKIYKRNIIRAKITGFCWLTSRENWNVIGAFDPTMSYEAGFQDWILRGFTKRMAPYINTGVYVHNFNQISDDEDNKYWKKDRPELVKKYGKAFSFLENELYDNLLKNNIRM